MEILVLYAGENSVMLMRWKGGVILDTVEPDKETFYLVADATLAPSCRFGNLG